MKPSFLWMTDPWSVLVHYRETTLRLIQEASRHDINQAWADVRSIRFEDGRVLVDVKPILNVDPTLSETAFQWGEPKTVPVDEFTQIHYRTDPPIDGAYIHPLQLLQMGTRANPRSKIVNPAHVLMTLNEKIEALSVPELLPPMIISSNLDSLCEFGRKNQKTVAKPLNDSKAKGVELLEWETQDQITENRAFIQEITQNFRLPMVLQLFLPEIHQGETRLWFMDGDLLSCAKKSPAPGEFRASLGRGCVFEKTELTSELKAKANLISVNLKRHQIRLAAIDLISGYITDYNITSPGLLPLIENAIGENLAAPIIERLLDHP